MIKRTDIVVFTVFGIAFVLSILGLIFCPDLILHYGNMSDNNITVKPLAQFILTWGTFGFLYKYRYIPVIGKIWDGVCVFLLTLIALLAAGYAKKSIKEWWEKEDLESTMHIGYYIPN